jgi:uncharacterized membrane protein YdbT with pleckstrin-like domain
MKRYAWFIALGFLIVGLVTDLKPLLLVSIVLFVIAFLKTIREGKGSPAEGAQHVLTLTPGAVTPHFICILALHAFHFHPLQAGASFACNALTQDKMRNFKTHPTKKIVRLKY